MAEFLPEKLFLPWEVCKNVLKFHFSVQRFFVILAQNGKTNTFHPLHCLPFGIQNILKFSLRRFRNTHFPEVPNACVYLCPALLSKLRTKNMREITIPLSFVL